MRSWANTYAQDCILLKCSLGLGGMAPLYGVAPLKDPLKYENGNPDSTCYGGRLGSKFHSLKVLE